MKSKRPKQVDLEMAPKYIDDIPYQNMNSNYDPKKICEYFKVLIEEIKYYRKNLVEKEQKRSKMIGVQIDMNSAEYRAGYIAGMINLEKEIQELKDRLAAAERSLERNSGSTFIGKQSE